MVGVFHLDKSQAVTRVTVGRGMAVVSAGLAVIAIGAQLILQGYYADRILPGVHVAGQDLGSLTLAQARDRLSSQAKGYRLELMIDGKPFVAGAADLGVTYNVERTLRQAYQARRDALLPQAASLPLETTIDTARLNDFSKGVAAKIGTEATDATLMVKGAAVETVGDKNGWSIDPAALATLIARDVVMPSGTPVKLAATQQPAKILASAVGPAVQRANQLMSATITLTYSGRSFSPDAEEIGSWLTFGKPADGGTATLVTGVDVSKVRGYVQQIAGTVNVAPVDKKVTIENGVTKVTSEGADGTAMDQDPAVAAIQTALSSNQPLNFAVASHVVPFKTVSTTIVSLDYGRYVEVNLSKQHLWVWQDHQVIYDTPITSGATGAGFPTVTGLFSIYYKATNTHLRGYAYGPRYNYDVQVNYWMPFYSGYGMHDASWRNGNFGGSDYYYGGSHGCVNLPDDAAAFIYNWADVGTPVWVH